VVFPVTDLGALEPYRVPVGTLAVNAVPDETTILNFRHWLERHDLSRALFEEVSAMLDRRRIERDRSALSSRFTADRQDRGFVTRVG